MTLEEHATKQAELQKIYEVMKDYAGRDEVVKSEEIKKQLENKPKIQSVYSGFDVLDKAVGGFRRGELIVISGPTGMGKTLLCQSFTYQFAEQGITPLWFSYEVVAEDLIERFSYNLPSFALPKEIQTNTLEWLEQRIWEGLAKYDTKVIFIDHLHYLLDMKELANTNTSLAIGALMRKIKLLALKTGTIIFLISHMKMTKIENEPDISDLRDSSFVGQEADMVFFTWRDKKINRENGRIEYGQNLLKIEKNRRKGELKVIPMIYEKNRLFEEPI